MYTLYCCKSVCTPAQPSRDQCFVSFVGFCWLVPFVTTPSYIYCCCCCCCCHSAGPRCKAHSPSKTTLLRRLLVRLGLLQKLAPLLLSQSLWFMSEWLPFEQSIKTAATSPRCHPCPLLLRLQLQLRLAHTPATTYMCSCLLAASGYPCCFVGKNLR